MLPPAGAIVLQSFEPEACICPACPTLSPFSHHWGACPEFSVELHGATWQEHVEVPHQRSLLLNVVGFVAAA